MLSFYKCMSVLHIYMFTVIYLSFFSAPNNGTSSPSDPDFLFNLCKGSTDGNPGKYRTTIIQYQVPDPLRGSCQWGGNTFTGWNEYSKYLKIFSQIRPRPSLCTASTINGIYKLRKRLLVAIATVVKVTIFFRPLGPEAHLHAKSHRDRATNN